MFERGMKSHLAPIVLLIVDRLGCKRTTVFLAFLLVGTGWGFFASLAWKQNPFVQPSILRVYPERRRRTLLRSLRSFEGAILI